MNSGKELKETVQYTSCKHREKVSLNWTDSEETEDGGRTVKIEGRISSQISLLPIK